jgi:hypothetical protein
VAVFGLAVFGDAGRTDAPAITAAMMTTLLAVWLFLHFTQYLVIWSANLPGEIVWYQHRGLGLGGPAIWFAATAAAIGLVALALLTLAPARSPRMAAVTASVAAMLLLMHLVEMFWLVTPAFRHRFTLAAPDLPALLALGGLAVGVVLTIEAFARRRRGHVAAQ